MNGLATDRPPAMRVLAVVALAVVALAGAARLPQQWRMFVQPALPVVRLWSDAEAQHRLQYADVPFDLLRAAEAALPADATVLLVTSGKDVRGVEYRTFHQALYMLTPRPVWWQSPAPPDGTWESNWWIAAPLDTASVLATTADRGAGYVLVVDAPGMELPGRRLLEQPDGYLLQLSVAEPVPIAPPLPSFQAGRAWPLRLAGGLFVILAIGDALLALAVWLNWRSGRAWTPPAGIERLALTWILGSGLVSLGMLGLNLPGLDLAVQVVAISAAAASWLGWRLWRRLRRRGRRDAVVLTRQPRVVWRNVLAGLLIALILVQLLLAGVLAMGQPLAGWDSWTSWGMRARTIFLENGISPAVYADASRASTRPGYPLLMPLVQSFLYCWLGAADDRLAGLVPWLFFAALVGLVYGAVRRRSKDRVFALLAAAATASIPWLVSLSGLTYVDVALAALAAAAAVSLIDWLDAGAGGALVLATVAAALMPWTKQEGLVLAAILLLAAIVVSPPRRGPRGWMAGLAGGSAALLVALIWGWVAAESPAARAFLPLAAATLQANLGRVPVIWRIVLDYLASVDFALLWPVALILGLSTLALPASERRAAWRNNTTLLPLATASFLAIMSTVYLFSGFRPYHQHVLSSYFRLASQVAPLAVLWMAYLGSRADQDR